VATVPTRRPSRKNRLPSRRFCNITAIVPSWWYSNFFYGAVLTVQHLYMLEYRQDGRQPGVWEGPLDVRQGLLHSMHLIFFDDYGLVQVLFSALADHEKPPCLGIVYYFICLVDQARQWPRPIGGLSSCTVSSTWFSFRMSYGSISVNWSSSRLLKISRLFLFSTANHCCGLSPRWWKVFATLRNKHGTRRCHFHRPRLWAVDPLAYSSEISQTVSEPSLSVVTRAVFCSFVLLCACCASGQCIFSQPDALPTANVFIVLSAVQQHVLSRKDLGCSEWVGAGVSWDSCGQFLWLAGSYCCTASFNCFKTKLHAKGVNALLNIGPDHQDMYWHVYLPKFKMALTDTLFLYSEVICCKCIGKWLVLDQNELFPSYSHAEQIYVLPEVTSKSKILEY